MKSSRLGRWLSIPCAAIALTISTASAEDPQLAPPADVHDHKHSQLYYSEPGPTVTATRDVDGVTEEVETITTWRPICGSDLGNMTQEQFAAFVATLKAQEAAANFETLDNPTPHGGGLNIVFNVSGAPAGAAAAIAAVETYLEGLFSDAITVNINLLFQNLGGGGVLGATSSSSTNVGYSTVRASLVNGMDGDDTLQTFLPASSVPVHFNGASTTITNVTTINVNTANYRAVIGPIGTNPDATMQINTNFAFDFDPSNGISGTCFRTVLVHEVLHGLGFVSQGDGSGSSVIKTLDIYRFRRTQNNPSTTTDFTTFPRAVWTSNRIADDVNSDFIPVEYRMSWGGSGQWQASHWRDQGGVPNNDVGIMNPAIAGGVTWSPNYLQTSDLAAMDAIGWDYPAVIVDTTPPTPNPMQFNNVPAATSDEAITMMSVIATDTQHNSITYFFDYVGVAPEANDSPWQSSIIYTDNGLNENTSYTYRVKARDSATPPVETLFSPTSSAITHMRAPTGVNVSNVTATECDLSAIGTFTNLNLGSSGIFFNWVFTAGGADAGNSGWLQANSHHVTGLTPDTYYTFRAKARNQESLETSTNQSLPFRTLAATPGAPIVGTGSLDVDPNGNPPTVVYAIQCVSTVPNDPVWLNKWVAFDGTPLAFEDFLSDADWGVRSLSSLTNGVTYQFAVKARNTDFFETPLGPPANLTVGTGTAHADCDGNGTFDVVADTACFVDVLLDVNTDPGAISRSDVNADAVTNGLDIAAFVNCALTGCP